MQFYFNELVILVWTNIKVKDFPLVLLGAIAAASQ